jgi:hypothetical protein
MIERRFKKIFKLVGLIAVRQIWKLICNLYHFANQPFLTVKLLLKEKDKSQLFLLSITSLMPFIMYITARIIWDHYKYGRIILDGGRFFILTFIMELIIFIYVGFWFYRAIKSK